MEKILVNSYGDVLGYNTVTNALTLKLDSLSYNSLYKAKEDGEVITDTEVITVKKGEWVLTARAWDDSIKVVIFSDPVAIYDLDQLKLAMDPPKEEEPVPSKEDGNEVI